MEPTLTDCARSFCCTWSVARRVYVPPRLQSYLVQIAQVAATTQPTAPNTVTYKGYTIQTTSGPEGERFVAFIKSVIDMSEQLPPDLLKLARGLTDLRYEPRTPNDNGAGVILRGPFRRDPKTGKGYIGYAENYATRGQAQIVISLVFGGIYQRRDAAKIHVSRDTKGDCEIDDYEIKTMEALKLDAAEINRAYKHRTADGCG